MTPRIHSVVACGALLIAWFAPHARGQDAATAAGSVPEELRALRQLIEQQAKQIDSLTAQITRLGGELEKRNLASSSTPLPSGNGEAPPPETNAPAAASAPAAKVVAPAGNVHIVVKGESLDKIAKQHNTTITELQKLNKITDPKKLQIGQQLTLPAAGAPEKKEGQ